MSIQPQSDPLAVFRGSLQAIQKAGNEDQTPSMCELKGILLRRIAVIDAAMRRVAELASAAHTDTIAGMPTLDKEP
jgi:hypothetical protein